MVCLCSFLYCLYLLNRNWRWVGIHDRKPNGMGRISQSKGMFCNFSLHVVILDFDELSGGDNFFDVVFGLWICKRNLWIRRKIKGNKKQ